MGLEPLVDSFGRPVSSLRVSVTQRCDLACFFCHREGEHDPGREMTPAEIGRIVEVAGGLGVSKAKVTGGEPLMRKDIVEVIRLISPHVKEVSMTTNSLQLPGRAIALKKAGLKRVNISLHSLKRESVRRS